MVNMFIAMLGVGLVIPILPKFLLEFGASGKDMGYLVAAMGLTQFLFSPIGGGLSDKYGRKIITVIGLTILMLSQLIFTFGTELWLLYVSRFIGGIGIGFLIPSNMAYVADVTSVDKRGRGMGLMGAAFTLGFVVSPGIGGYLAEFGLRVPFYVSSVVAAIAMIVSLLFLPETLSKDQQLATRNTTKKNLGMIQSFKKSFKSSYLVLLILVFTMTFGLANFESIFGLYVDQKYGYTPTDIATLMTIGALVGVIIQALLIEKLIRIFGEVKLINICFLFAALSMVLILLSGNFWYILVMNIIFIVFTSILRPAISTLLSKMAGNEQGYAAGMNNAYSSIGNILGPSMAGILFDYHFHLPYFFGASILLFSLALCLVWNQKMQRKSTVLLELGENKY
jgi:MFS transporter, DHA1 family, multidrug resistance protein